MNTGTTMRYSLVSIAGFLLVAAPGALAWPDGELCSHGTPGRDDPPREIRGFDPDTGRSLLTFPPHPLVDFGHMKLVIDIPDMNTPRFAAVQTLTVKAVGTVATLTL